MAKNLNDKYYTPDNVVKEAMKVLLKYFPAETITEIIEPSAGDGAFVEEIKKLGKPYKLFDLYPEHPEIEKMDFKELKLPYQKGRVFVGNPPFGNASSLFKRFRNRAVEMGDGAVYISPASHWEMKYGLKGMRLVYSKHLGSIEYSGNGDGEDKKVNTCLNVYMRGEEESEDRMGRLNQDFEIKTIDFKNQEGKIRRDNLKEKEYVYYLNAWARVRFIKTEWPLTHSIYWVVNIKNENLRDKADKFFERFPDYYREEMIKVSSGKNGTKVDLVDPLVGITKVWLKQKMIEYFYPTKEERLIQDFDIKTVHFIKKDKDNNRIYPSKKEYDYYLNAWARVKFIKTEWPLTHSVYYYINVLNEGLREKADYLLNNFNKIFYEELIKVSRGKNEAKISLVNPNVRITDGWLKQKMIKYFYPTKEERLNQDVKISMIKYYKNGRYADNLGIREKDYKDYDYYMGSWGDGVVGKVSKTPKYNTSWGVKILNEDIRKDVEDFLHSFREKHFDYIKNISEAAANVLKSYFKKKLIEHLYPEEDYDQEFITSPKTEVKPKEAAVPLF